MLSCRLQSSFSFRGGADDDGALSVRTPPPATRDGDAARDEYALRTEHDEAGERHGEEEAAAAADGEFDAVEAAAQEIHDLVAAMRAYLQRSLNQLDCANGGIGVFGTPQKGVQREYGPKFQVQRVHRATHRSANFASAKEALEARDVFAQHGTKLLALLTEDVLDRLMRNAARTSEASPRPGAGARRGVVERMRWRQFPVRYFKHAPFEVQQLRADMPETFVDMARALRDRETLAALRALCGVPHLFNEALNQKIWALTRRFDHVEQQPQQ